MGERPFKLLFYKASAFYDQEFLDNKNKELGRLFKQEYPETAEEAFLTSGECYFSLESLRAYLENAIEPVKKDLIYV